MFQGRGVNTIKMVRELQPDILVNNRTGDGGDYDTPEQRGRQVRHGSPLGVVHDDLGPQPLGVGRAGRRRQAAVGVPADAHPRGRRQRQTCCSMSDRVPMVLIDPEQVARLREIGAWLAKYGESIYGTRGGPYKPTKSVASTRKGNTVYVHITAWPEETLGPAAPACQDPQSKRAHRRRGDREARRTTGSRSLSPNPTVRKWIPSSRSNSTSPRWRSQPLSVRAGGQSLTTGKQATASNVYQNNNHYDAAKAVDDDEGTRWGDRRQHRPMFAGSGPRSKPETFDRALIDECVDFGVRAKAFELQYRDGDAWENVPHR